jgi:hypothetical protein
MAHLKATSVDAPPGWRVFRSDKGRFWATREEPYPEPEQTAWRTVDADDLTTLCRTIAEQESRAELGASS